MDQESVAKVNFRFKNLRFKIKNEDYDRTLSGVSFSYI